jgi:acid stress-induced BolA-like protein IbaG/YrbA
MTISNEAVTELLTNAIPNAKVTVSGDGYKYQANIISDAFEGLNTMKRHLLVYAALNEVITSGELHALTIKAHTKDEV